MADKRITYAVKTKKALGARNFVHTAFDFFFFDSKLIVRVGGRLYTIMSFRKRYMIVTNPDVGQTSPLLALTEELALRGNQVVFVSGASALKRVQRSQRALGFPVQMDAQPSIVQLQTYPIAFFSLGESLLLSYLDQALIQPERFHRQCRRPPGKIMSFIELYIDLVNDSSDEYRDLVWRVRDLVEQVDPDLLVVDNFSPFAVDGIRLTKRPFIETAPGAVSSVASHIHVLQQPLPMRGGRSSSIGFVGLLSNLYFIVRWLLFVFFHAWSKRRRAFRHEVLGLTDVPVLDDAMFPPPPGKLPQHIASITFNVEGMDIYPASAYERSVFFVGPCFAPSQRHMPPGVTLHALPPSAPAVSDAQMDDPVKLWLDEAHAQGRRVLYINMGSIFFYMRRDYDHILACLERLHKRFPTLLVLWKIPDHPQRIQPVPTADEAVLPSYIRRESWLPSIHNVLSHPAVAVIMHHGGGNSYNESIAYGVPQFCVSQWVDTHDIGLYVQNSGVGLWADKSPEFDPDDMYAKLSRMIIDEGHTFRHTALAWRIKALQAGGTARSADIIETYASSYTFEQGSSKGPVAQSH